MTGDEIHVPAGHTKGEVMSRAQRIMYAVIRALIEGACRVWFRLEVHGAEHLPAEGAYIALADPPLQPRHAGPLRHHHPTPPLHGQGIAVELAGAGLAAHRPRWLPREAGHRGP